MKRALNMLSQTLQLMLMLALVVMSARFTWVAARPFLDVPSSVPTFDNRGEPGRSAGIPLPQNPLPQKPTAAPVAPQNEMVNLLLLAQHSRPNSQVFVNDALIGQTNFMRNFTCRRGEILRLRIQPHKGRAVEREARCDGATISISDH